MIKYKHCYRKDRWRVIGFQWFFGNNGPSIRNNWTSALKLVGAKLSEIRTFVMSDDAKYRYEFETHIGSDIYNSHIKRSYKSCAFCSNLFRSTCHNHCFRCYVKINRHCDAILPGTFPFSGSISGAAEETSTPWLYRKPCQGFDRLRRKTYYANFKSRLSAVTTANYEVLEGIFTGLTRGKRPCHICASVDLEIFNRCSQSGYVESIPCDKIYREISSAYKTIRRPAKQQRHTAC